MFDENTTYEKGEIDLMQLVDKLMLKSTFDIFEFSISAVIELDSDFDEEITLNADNIINSDQSKEKQLDRVAFNQNFLSSSSSIFSASSALENSENFNPFLTSDENSDTDALDALEKNPQSSSASGTRKFVPSITASRDISSRFDESNIISERVKRTRIRKQAYLAVFDRIEVGDDQAFAFHGFFNAHLGASDYYQKKSSQQNPQEISSIKPHRNDLPFEFQHYGDFRKHLHIDDFKRAMRIELNALKSKSTWSEVFFDGHIVFIPITWVFKYKFDDQGYLIKHKARLCARDDLQKIEQNTYAATLAARIFRALMAIVNAFDLETRQYNAINAFVNSEINEPIYLSNFLLTQLVTWLHASRWWLGSLLRRTAISRLVLA